MKYGIVVTQCFEVGARMRGEGEAQGATELAQVVVEAVLEERVATTAVRQDASDHLVHLHAHALHLAQTDAHLFLNKRENSRIE